MGDGVVHVSSIKLHSSIIYYAVTFDLINKREEGWRRSQFF